MCSVAVVLLFINAGIKQKQDVPPGTVQINDTLFADETEISNLSWLEYVYYNERKYGKNSQEYLFSLPDTTVWRQKGSYNEPYVQYYFRHVAYNNYPVVGISYEQAKAYCVWRSERVNYFINIRDGKQINHPDSVFRGKPIYEYRLPTKQEWEALALVGISDKVKIKPWTRITYDEKSKKKKVEKIHRTATTLETVEQFFDVTSPVNTHYPNKLGLFNLKGNVSEMTSEKGIAKGGSWMDLAEKCFLLNDFNYSIPSANIGFRCVCVKRN
jgi:formylglycine-generating enzyme required for sulfatase activity